MGNQEPPGGDRGLDAGEPRSGPGESQPDTESGEVDAGELRPNSDDGALDAGEPELLRRCREGDPAAFEELFRRHRAPALRIASAAGGALDPDDVVAESFARIWAALRDGGGPERSFGGYLRTTIRNVCITAATRNREDAWEDDRLELGLLRDAPAGDGFSGAIAEHEVVARAFNSLPERWRRVLWSVEVEGRRAAEVADDLGLTPNSAAALTMRARDALSQAWLQQHVERHPADGECQWVLDHTGGFVRHTLTERQKTRVSHHLDSCNDCGRAAHRLAHLAVSLRIAALVGAGSAAGIASWAAQGAQPAVAAATLVPAGTRPRTGGRKPSRTARLAMAATAACVALLVLAGAAQAAWFGGGAADDLAVPPVSMVSDGRGRTPFGGAAAEVPDSGEPAQPAESQPAGPSTTPTGTPLAAPAESAASPKKVRPPAAVPHPPATPATRPLPASSSPPAPAPPPTIQPAPSATATPVPTVRPTTPSPAPTPEPSLTPTPGPTRTPTAGPTRTPTPDPTPTVTPAPEPTPTPSAAPSRHPTATPSPSPSGPTPSCRPWHWGHHDRCCWFGSGRKCR